MKPQDIAFIVVFLLLLAFRRRNLFVIAGLVAFAAAIPLYSRWIFFSAHRLVLYGAALIATALLFDIVRFGKKGLH